mmetsp:Transcript_28405/g.57217  ORF Transcript_28405/g.57217 Transcript_28405/m.57217 type:complete len:325 (+) Transcript_28405:436-1410(+)
MMAPPMRGATTPTAELRTSSEAREAPISDLGTSWVMRDSRAIEESIEATREQGTAQTAYTLTSVTVYSKQLEMAASTRATANAARSPSHRTALPATSPWNTTLSRDLVVRKLPICPVLSPNRSISHESCCVMAARATRPYSTRMARKRPTAPLPNARLIDAKMGFLLFEADVFASTVLASPSDDDDDASPPVAPLVGGRNFMTMTASTAYKATATTEGAAGCMRRIMPVTAEPVTHAAVAMELMRPMYSARWASSDHAAAMALEAVMVCLKSPTTTRLNTKNQTVDAAPTMAYATAAPPNDRSRTVRRSSRRSLSTPSINPPTI